MALAADDARDQPTATQVIAVCYHHESEFVQSNTTVVTGRDGVLLVDPGMRDDEIACLADNLTRAGQTTVAGFSTHSDWDHVLWHSALGDGAADQITMVLERRGQDYSTQPGFQDTPS